MISLTRQWFLRSGAWKITAALTGAAVQVITGGLGWLVFGHPRIAALRASETASIPPDQIQFMLCTLCALSTVLISVIALAIWAGRFNRARIYTGEEQRWRVKR